MDETAARRRDPLEGAGGFAVAGCAGVLRLLAGGVKELPGGVVDEPEDHALGRSRGGLTTKIHLSYEQGQ
jgi:hypothetical protein